VWYQVSVLVLFPLNLSAAYFSSVILFGHPRFSSVDWWLSFYPGALGKPETQHRIEKIDTKKILH